MTAKQVVLLIAMILVSGGVLSTIFKWLSLWIPKKDWMRMIIVWIICVLGGWAEVYVAGGFFNLTQPLAASEVFAVGNSVFAAATAVYNFYWKPRAQKQLSAPIQ